MANYKLPGPLQRSEQGACDPSLIRTRNGRPWLISSFEKFLENIQVDRHVLTKEEVELISSDRLILIPLCDRIRKHMDQMPEADPDRASHLLDFGRLLQKRAAVTGDTADLEPCLQYLEQAISITPEGHPNRADCLSALAYNYYLWSQKTFQVADADKALHYGQQAINAITESRSSREFLHALGSILRQRYTITYQIADLQHSIRYLQAALEAPQTDHEIHVDILNNLSNIHEDLFDRIHRGADLELAIQYAQEALKCLPDGSKKRTVLLNNLAIRLFSRSGISLRVADIDMAIQYGQQALASTSLSDPTYGAYLISLGTFFKGRFRMTRQAADLDQAIRHQEALKYTPSEVLLRAEYQLSLGDSFQERVCLTKKKEDLIAAFRAFIDGFTSDGIPFYRLSCGFNAIKIAVSLPQDLGIQSTVAMVEEILETIPLVFERTGSRNDTEHILQRLPGLASFSASVLIAAKLNPSQVLCKLERSRGMITGLVIDIRSEVVGLKEKHPDLWWRYTQCRNSLGAMNSRALKMGNEQNYAGSVERLGQLHNDLSDMKEEIRKVPGFEDFLLSSTETEMRELARNGSIISFNVSMVNSAAFLVTTSEIQVLSLPDLKFKDVSHWVKTFASYGNSTRRDASLCEDEEEQKETRNQSTVSEMNLGLSSLWTVAVKRVLRQLKLLNQPDSRGRLPQIWWVGGGLMGLLPLHAAGDHSPGSTENTLSHVISSYSPTFKFLQFIQNRPRLSISRVKQELLLVAMPTTPEGYKPLNVVEEVTAIKNSTLKWASSKTLVKPYKKDVLDALKTCAIAHFACHGTADRIQPAKSALLIGKESVERLTVEDLDSISCQNAQILYLSACSTAEIGITNLADESIHLASSFQVAGFRHVIGTLWGADDNAAVEVATKFYEDLPQYNENGYVSVARALHCTVTWFRNTGGNWKDFSKWAPFIHLGC